jgi:hypothetical protein
MYVVCIDTRDQDDKSIAAELSSWTPAYYSAAWTESRAAAWQGHGGWQHVVSGTAARRAGAWRQTQKEHDDAVAVCTYGELYKYTHTVFYQDADTAIKIRVKTSWNGWGVYSERFL